MFNRSQHCIVDYVLTSSIIHVVVWL